MCVGLCPSACVCVAFHSHLAPTRHFWRAHLSLWKFSHNFHLAPGPSWYFRIQFCLVPADSLRFDVRHFNPTRIDVCAVVSFFLSSNLIKNCGKLNFQKAINRYDYYLVCPSCALHNNIRYAEFQSNKATWATASHQHNEEKMWKKFGTKPTMEKKEKRKPKCAFVEKLISVCSIDIVCRLLIQIVVLCVHPLCAFVYASVSYICSINYKLYCIHHSFTKQ